MLPAGDISNAVVPGSWSAIAAARGLAKPGDMPAASVRHALRALACETGPQAGQLLLHLFRRHAHNVLQAAGLTTAPVPAEGPETPA